MTLFQVGEEYMLTYPEELWINCTITCPNDSHPGVDGIWTFPQIITKMLMFFEKTYSTATLPFISHNWLFLWDYTFHKWCLLVLLTGISGQNWSHSWDNNGNMMGISWISHQQQWFMENPYSIMWDPPNVLNLFINPWVLQLFAYHKP